MTESTATPPYWEVNSIEAYAATTGVGVSKVFSRDGLQAPLARERHICHGCFADSDIVHSIFRLAVVELLILPLQNYRVPMNKLDSGGDGSARMMEDHDQDAQEYLSECKRASEFPRGNDERLRNGNGRGSTLCTSLARKRRTKTTPPSVHSGQRMKSQNASAAD